MDQLLPKIHDRHHGADDYGDCDQVQVVAFCSRFALDETKSYLPHLEWEYG
jgi:hypothetical protein